MVDQLENERRLMGEATFKSLMKEMWQVPANRRRAIIAIVLMVCQQLTGVNAIVCWEHALPYCTLLPSTIRTKLC